MTSTQPSPPRPSFLSGWRVRRAIVRSAKRAGLGLGPLHDDLELLARAADGELNRPKCPRHERVTPEDRDAAEALLEAWWGAAHPP